jgi:hypothetical protein
VDAAVDECISIAVLCKQIDDGVSTHAIPDRPVAVDEFVNRQNVRRGDHLSESQSVRKLQLPKHQLRHGANGHLGRDVDFRYW